MVDGKYFYAKEGSKVFFKLTGTLKYTISSKFDAFLDRFLGNEMECEDLMIDLSEAEFLDSTNLGFLARISEFMREKCNRRVTLFSPNTDINSVLESVGFDEVFILVNDYEKSEKALSEVSGSGLEERQRAVMMLDAHKALMKVSDKNINKFHDVVELLEKSIEKPE